MLSNDLFLNLLFFVFLLVKAVHPAGQSARRNVWSPPLVLQVGKATQQKGGQLSSQLLKQERTSLHKHGSSHLPVAKSASSCRVRAAYGSHKVSAMLKSGKQCRQRSRVQNMYCHKLRSEMEFVDITSFHKKFTLDFLNSSHVYVEGVNNDFPRITPMESPHKKPLVLFVCDNYARLMEV